MITPLLALQAVSCQIPQNLLVQQSALSVSKKLSENSLISFTQKFKDDKKIIQKKREGGGTLKRELPCLIMFFFVVNDSTSVAVSQLTEF